MDAPMHLKVEVTSGDSYECETPWRMWQCLADRVAFERRFSASFAEYSARARVGETPDEWVSFFAWRALARGVPELAQLAFDDFVEQAVELTVERQGTDQEEAPEVAAVDDGQDPTVAALTG